MPGVPGDDADDLTIAATRAITRSPGSLGSSSTPSSIPFAPGAIIAGRYRLVSLLGRGGMGEVYRADDLTLDQTVALKFLPAGVAADSDRLAQFHAELRIARQVSHKNVCRLYDLGDHEGRRFLTMEYVDGEDLATLLRRIGRLPHDKAVEIARQLCAGIAAAHERGVLHRDLKPANVMIDGDGNVRITDFGLAVAAGDVNASRAGTPQYMAPEQLTGGTASVRSDIYALGLILFEMFTGKRVFEAKTFNELLSLHETRTITNPSSMVRDLDPAVERVILRCLDHDPALRPGSALLVAAALPGGDPIAAALAAGETPSPEMVAAAGGHTAYSLRIGLSLFGIIVAGLLAVAALSDRTMLIARIPLDKSVDVLEGRARDILEKLGYTERPADSARGYFMLQDFIFYTLRTDQSPARWNALSNGYVPTLRFWYRTSPRDLEPFGAEWRPGFGDPPMTVSDMTSMFLDTQGHLTQFTMVPPQVEDVQTAAPTNWAALFDAAGLDPGTFTPASSQWVPNGYADERKAWEGPMPGRPEIRLRVEAAAYRGRLAFFQIVGPWTRRPRMAQDGQQGRAIIRFGLFLIVSALSIGTLALARRNVRSGRGDRRGATRIALALVGISCVAWLVGARHSTEPLTEFGHFLADFASEQVTAAVMLWLIYVALEPYVRRYSPEILTSWSRLISGRLHDPRVGRDILVGIAAGVGIAAASMALVLLPPLFGSAPPPPRNINLAFLQGTGQALSRLLLMPSNALFDSMLITLAFALTRMLVKRTWLAAMIAGVLLAFVAIGQAGTEYFALNALLAVTISAVCIVVLVSFGMFAQMMTFLTWFILSQGSLTLDPAKLYATTSIWLLMLVAGLAAFGFYASRAGEPLFGKLAET